MMRRSIALAIAVTLLALAGCAGSSNAPGTRAPAVATLAIAATATPTATPKPTPKATPKPTPTPTAKPTPTIDPSAGLKIAAPYALRHLDPFTQAAYEGAMTKALGSFGSLLKIGIREVTKSGAPSGFVMVIDFNNPTLAGTSGFLDAVAGGSATSMGGKLTKKTILGTQVRYTSASSGAFAAYQHGGGIVYVLLPTSKAALAVITALIKANR